MQFVAKMYTEALGRIPDQSGWDSALGFFASSCTSNQLKMYATNLLTSSEFSALRYDNAARVLVAHRALYGRDPSASEFSYSLAQLDNGAETWPQFVSRLLNAPPFGLVSVAACLNDGKPYSWGTNKAIAIGAPGASGDFAGGTSSELQALLDSTPPGGRVRLNQKALVLCDSPITIPEGVRLETYAVRRPNLYALMGRLVRVTNFDGAMVTLLPGAQLIGVWVDGQVGAQVNANTIIQPTLGDLRANILMYGRQTQTARATRVDGCRSSNSAGGTHLSLHGTSDIQPDSGNWRDPCGVATAPSLESGLGSVAKYNLITGYANRHKGYAWSDGVSVKCENSIVSTNQIIDATDGAIVVFSLDNDGVRPPAQRSKIVRNKILASGNSAFYGIDLTPGANAISGAPPPQSAANSFDGAWVHRNTLWTGPRAHFDVTLSIGGRIADGNFSDVGRGARVQRNTSGPFYAVTNNGIVVNGMREAIVTGNTITPDLQSIDLCQVADVAASVQSGWASGVIQDYVDIDSGISACVGGAHAE